MKNGTTIVIVGLLCLTTMAITCVIKGIDNVVILTTGTAIGAIITYCAQKLIKKR